MPRVGLTTDRVVAAAADLADEAGFESVTVSALARHFVVKDASLYTHVRNLQDLRVRVALLAGGELIDEIAAAVAGGYCALEASGGFGAPRDVRAPWDKAVDALHVALEHWPRAPGGLGPRLTLAGQAGAATSSYVGAVPPGVRPDRMSAAVSSAAPSALR
ncbi:hypothetical protein SUDANB140_06166 [Streptomyces sp. enrichment culture]